MIHVRVALLASITAASIAAASCAATAAAQSGTPAPSDPEQRLVMLSRGACLDLLLSAAAAAEEEAAVPLRLSICHTDGEGVVITRRQGDETVTFVQPDPAADMASSVSLGDGDVGLLSQSVSIDGDVAVSGAGGLNRVEGANGCPTRTIVYDRVRSGTTDVLVIDTDPNR